MTIAEIFKNSREALGYSQAAFAEILGIGQAAVSAIEKGKVPNPSYEVIQALIFKAGVNPLYVFNIDTTVSPVMHPSVTLSRLKGVKASDLHKSIIKEMQESLAKLKSLKD